MSKLTFLRHWSRQRVRKWLVAPLYRQLYRDENGDLGRSMMVAGAARSGTTWLARIISSQLPCRVMFEPFHSRLVQDYAPFHYFQYMRPESSNDALSAYCQRVFSGAIRHRWIDREVGTLTPRYRLIKEIRANLFLKWIHEQFPQVPLLFVLRHPCAVVLSRLELGWDTDGDIAPFLAQDELLQDFLADKRDVIGGARTPEEKHAVIWSISNLVPLTQFAPGQLPVVFYEQLCTRPYEEVERIFGALDHSYSSSVFETLQRPSTTATSSSAVIHGDNRVTRWQQALSARQIDDILTVVEAFGLGNLYDESPMPRPDALKSHYYEPLREGNG
jgi:hypothetical protein